jgi:hypothetical protein
MGLLHQAGERIGRSHTGATLSAPTVNPLTVGIGIRHFVMVITFADARDTFGITPIRVRNGNYANGRAQARNSAHVRNNLKDLIAERHFN